MNGSITSGSLGLPCLLWSLIVALLVGGGVARAEPCTLYKPEDIKNARRNLKRFEWAERIVDGWKRSVEFAMQHDQRFFEELIPELTPGSPYTNGCPACVDPELKRAARNLRWRVSDAPGWRNHTEAARGRPPVQQILVENRARDDATTLATQYAAVIVPYQSDASPVVAARLLKNEAETGVIALEVQLAGRTDYIVSTMDQQQRRYGPVSVAGRFAFVSVDDEDRAVHGYLLAGQEVACGELKIRLPEPSTTLKVRSVSDRTFHLADRLPSGAVSVGGYLLACGPVPRSGETPRPRTGFEIESFTADSITVRDYPVVECDEVKVLHSTWQCRNLRTVRVLAPRKRWTSGPRRR